MSNLALKIAIKGLTTTTITIMIIIIIAVIVIIIIIAVIVIILISVSNNYNNHNNNSDNYSCSLGVFSHQRLLKVFQWSLSDNKSPQISRTLLSILADLNNAVVQIVLNRSPISNSSSPLSKPLGSIPSAPIAINITITLIILLIMIHSQ